MAEVEGVTIEDLTLYFTIPGYDIELRVSLTLIAIRTVADT
jgi:hypothetical protein